MWAQTSFLIGEAQHVDYLIEMTGKCHSQGSNSWTLAQILYMLNHHLSQKVKLIRICRFNHLIKTFNTPSRVDSSSLLIGEA
jgi:hypothetical protein